MNQIIKNMLFSFLLVGLNLTAGNKKDINRALNGVNILCTITLSCLVYTAPSPTDLNINHFMCINGITSIIAIGGACLGNNSEIASGISAVTTMINVGMVGYTVWQRYQKYHQENQSDNAISWYKEQLATNIMSSTHEPNKWAKDNISVDQNKWIQKNVSVKERKKVIIETSRTEKF